jgi:hypothetical protein
VSAAWTAKGQNQMHASHVNANKPLAALRLPTDSQFDVFIFRVIPCVPWLIFFCLFAQLLPF